MKIIYDTREQKPLPFEVKGPITEVRREKLDVGDYAVEFEDGYRPNICYERKSFPDLYGTLAKGYKRFRREIDRAHESQTRLYVIVERSLSKVAEGFGIGKRNPESVVQQVFTIQEKYGVPFVFTASRWESVYWITHHFMAIGREHVKQKDS